MVEIFVKVKTVKNTILACFLEQNIYYFIYINFRYPGGDCTSDIYVADMDAKVAKL